MSFVLLMDATYKTNKFNMPLLLLSSVDPFGQTYVVACCLLTNETTLSYNTALSSFKQLFGLTVPIVNSIITDQETALMNAIADQFPDSSHQLCRWHLQANIKKNFGKNLPLCAKFSKFMHCENENLAEQIYKDMVESSSSEEAAYLKHLYDIRSKYAEVCPC